MTNSSGLMEVNFSEMWSATSYLKKLENIIYRLFSFLCNFYTNSSRSGKGLGDCSRARDFSPLQITLSLDYLSLVTICFLIFLS